jgi:hypothetical protein
MKELSLDSTVGGLGDVWMRLTALHSLSALVSGRKIQLRIPKSLVNVAQHVWPDRFLSTSDPLPGAIEITHLGLRHLLPRLLTGHQFLNPFYQILRADRKSRTPKHLLNEVLIQGANALGVMHVPTAASVECYQGYHEFSAVPEFRAVPYPSFLEQVTKDFPITRARMRKLWPTESPATWRVLVLPSGTGHQIMPPDWARTHLSDATFAFFKSDTYKNEFLEQGLQVAEFGSVEGLLKLAAQAQVAVVTDSFPSHPLQAYSAATVVALSQQPRLRIVHPAFDGRIIHSKAECTPCANLARGAGPCAAGLQFCTTWSHKFYTRELLASLA